MFKKETEVITENTESPASEVSAALKEEEQKETEGQKAITEETGAEETEEDDTVDEGKGLEIRLSVQTLLSVFAILIALMALFRTSDLRKSISDTSASLQPQIDSVRMDVDAMKYTYDSDGSVYEIRNCYDLEGYLSILSAVHGYTAMIVVKDIQGYSLKKEHTTLLEKMGFEDVKSLLEHNYHNFIGVIEDGKAIYEYVGGNEGSSYHSEIADRNVYLESATLYYGDKGIINIDGEDYSKDLRGFNIVVLNKKGRVVDSVAFDTHVDDIPCTR